MNKVIIMTISLLFAVINLAFSFSAPDPPDSVNIEMVDNGDSVRVSWYDEGYLYRVYSSDDPYATFPGADWTLETPVGVTGDHVKLATPAGDKKFYVVTADAVKKLGSRAESDPSETVGFIKIETEEGFTPFSLPFTFYDETHTETMLLDDIIKDQLTGGISPDISDQVININNGLSGWYNSVVGSWSMNSFTYNHGYYVRTSEGHSALDFYLCGTVETEAINLGIMNIGWNVVGIKEAGNIPIDSLDLIESGFTGGITGGQSDLIADMNTGCFSWYNTYLGQWIGSLTEISPGHVYLIFVQPGHNSFEWIYNPFGEKSVRQYNQLKGAKK